MAAWRPQEAGLVASLMLEAFEGVAAAGQRHHEQTRYTRQERRPCTDAEQALLLGGRVVR